MEKNENIDIKRLIDIISSKKIFIILIMLLSIVLGYVYSYYYKKPQYESSVTIFLAGDENQQNKQVTQSDLTLNSGLISTYSSIAKSANVVGKTISNLGLTMPIKSLQNNITVTEVNNTQIIKIKVTNKNAEMAMKITNELSEVFSEQIKEIYNLKNINIVDKAEIQENPININHNKDILIFAFIGIFISGVLVLLVYIFDDTIKTEKDIKNYLNMETLGTIPIVNKEDQKLISETNPKSYIVECLKTIRTNILYSTNKKTILLTSARQEEGKSWIANNIAVAFAQANKKVILVDCNLRIENNKNEIFDIESGEGLSDFIKEVSEDKIENLEISKNYIKETKIPNLHILTSGTIPPNPSELITSSNMEKILDLLKTMYDVVLLDSTPCMLVSDSIALSSMVDSTVLVVENKKTKINDIKKTKKLIKDVNGKISGIILNKKKIQDRKYYGKGYGYYYGEDTSKELEEIVVNQKIIKVDDIIQTAKEKIEQEKNNKQIEIVTEQITGSKEKTDTTDNKIVEVIKKVFNKILKIENKLKDKDLKEKQTQDFINKQQEKNEKLIQEIKNIKSNQENINKDLFSKVEQIKKDNLSDRDNILNSINNIHENNNNIKENINILQNSNNELKGTINSLQEDNSNVKENINTLQNSNNELKGTINSLQEDNNNVKENINILQNSNNELKENSNLVNENLTNSNNNIDNIKSQQDEMIEKIDSVIKEIEKMYVLKSKILELEKAYNRISELEQNITTTSGEIKNIKNEQYAQSNNLKDEIEILKQLQIRNNKELLEKIENINYDDKFTEINENILRSKDEYAKILSEINSNKEQEEKIDNIISFESLKEKKRNKEKTVKRVFSINESIMYEDLEKTSTYILDLNNNQNEAMSN